MSVISSDRRTFLRGAFATTAVGFGGFRLTGRRWYKGNLHTHTLVSDGESFPSEAALLYRDVGYDFLMFSDHHLVHDRERWVNEKNRDSFSAVRAERFVSRYPAFRPMTRTEADGTVSWRLAPFDETAARVNEPGRFLLMSGCEYNHSIVGGTELHFQSINSRFGDEARRCDTMLQSYEAHLVHFRKVTAREDAIFAVNHPLWWLYDVDPLLLADRDELRFFEVANAPYAPSPAVVVKCAYDEDRLWDFALARRCRRGAPLLYGIAADDTHSYGPFYEELDGRKGRRRGWVMVRAEELSESALLAAMRHGDFYASTGVELDDVSFEGGRLQVKVGGNVRCVIRFYGTKTGADLDDYDPGVPEKIADILRREGSKRNAPGYVGVERRIASLPSDVGIILAETQGSSASYALQPDDWYVRAKIVNLSNGDVAWTQPFRRI